MTRPTPHNDERSDQKHHYRDLPTSAGVPVGVAAHAASCIDIVLTRVLTFGPMSPRLKKLYTFPIDDDLARSLKALKTLEEKSEAELIREAIRFGIREWLRKRKHPRRAHESWGEVADRLEHWAAEKKKAERERAATRARS